MHDPLFLDAADRIGTRLCRDAVWVKDRCNWLGWALEPINGAIITVYRAQTSAIYDGTAGIGLFLARLAKLTGDPLQKTTALGALNQAFGGIPDLARDFRHSVYSGAAGVSYAGIEAGSLLGEERMAERGLAELKSACGDAPTDQWADVISGSAGAVQVLLSAAQRFDDPALMRFAEAHGRMLLRTAVKSDRGLSWDTMPGQTTGNLTGYGHGASGIGCALLELWRSTGDAAYRSAVLDAFRYERSYYSAEQKNWPDLRSAEGYSFASGQPMYARAWCHGAPGIGLARLRALELLGSDADVEQELDAAVQCTVESCSNVAFPGSGNMSLCHGLAGNADLLIDAARVRERSDLRLVAEETGKQAIAQIQAQDMPWPCGVNGGGETPNLMLGLSGIGHYYLRLYDPEQTPSVLLIRGAAGAREQRPSEKAAVSA